MEPKRRPVNSTAEWHEVLAESVTSLDSLMDAVGLPTHTPTQREVSQQYPLLVPRPFVDRISKHCPTDPLLTQILPQKEELCQVEGFTCDPIGERATTGPPGLIRKFHGRALIIANHSCSVHCRFCFRRHELQTDAEESPLKWATWKDAIARDRSISEVILSGGDPLMLEDEELLEGLATLGRIPHVRRIRIHTRVPIMIPQRITKNLLDILERAPCVCFIVVHVNHRNEIDATVEGALRRLRKAGIPLMAQTVLLRGVNDSVEALADLYEVLADLGVIPYYLHQLDRVDGAAHFEVPVTEGTKIVRRLRIMLPGYAVPRYVRERIGAEWKEPVE